MNQEDSPATSSAVQQLQALEVKRKALEGLVAVAQGLSKLEKAFQDIAIAAKPSQRIPEKVKAYLAQIQDKVKEMNDEVLVERMGALDKGLFTRLKKVMAVACVDENSDAPYMLPSPPEPKAFRELLSGFKRSTQTSVALRAVAKERGIPVKSMKLPIRQDNIALRIENLKEKEEHCRETIEEGIEEYIADSNIILACKDAPEHILEHAQKTKDYMSENLALLKAGKPIDELKGSFEEIQVKVSDNTHLYREEEKKEAVDEPKKEEPSQEAVKQGSSKKSESKKASSKKSSSKKVPTEKVSEEVVDKGSKKESKTVVADKPEPVSAEKPKTLKKKRTAEDRPEKKPKKESAKKSSAKVDVPPVKANGLFARFNYWLDSPWGITWKETKYRNLEEE